MLIDLMNTESGRCFFSIPEVNAHLKLIFDTYGEMLDSPLSLKHMNGEESGWLSPSEGEIPTRMGQLMLNFFYPL
jgi:hypothetical protein